MAAAKSCIGRPGESCRCADTARAGAGRQSGKWLRQARDGCAPARSAGASPGPWSAPRSSLDRARRGGPNLSGQKRGEGWTPASGRGAKASIFSRDGARPGGRHEDPCASGVAPCRSAGTGGARAAPPSAPRTPECWRRYARAGTSICGVGDGPKGYSKLTGDGTWTGIGVDFCKALAAAVLDSKDAVKFQAVPPSDRFSALQVGRHRRAHRRRRHDLEPRHGARHPLSRRTCLRRARASWCARSQGVASALELSGARVCVTAQTADARGRRRLFRRRSRCPTSSSKLDRWQEAAAAYTNKSCQVLSADVSVLAQARQQSAEPDKHIILPEIASQAADRAGDPAGRRGLVQRRALDPLCADRGRGARHHARPTSTP